MKAYPELDDILKIPLFRGLRQLIGTDTSNAKSFLELIPLLRQMCTDVPDYSGRGPYDYDEKTPSDYYDDEEDDEDDYNDKGHANFKSAVMR
jgi:hypothetical protein